MIHLIVKNIYSRSRNSNIIQRRRRDEYEVFQGEFYKSKYAENDIDMINLFETKEIDKVILDKTVLDKMK